MREKSDLDSIFSRQIKYHSVFIVIRKLLISRNAVVLSYNSETLLHTWIPGTYCSRTKWLEALAQLTKWIQEVF